jgi:hypothetical protein
MTEEENLALADRLGLTGDVLVMSTNSHYEPVVTDGFNIVLVEGDRIITATHGWGASGAHIDVRTYVGIESPQPTEPLVITLDKEVSVFAQDL